MAAYDEIEEALGCMECRDALELHLEYCEPGECGVVEAFRRTRARVEAGEHRDFGSPARMAMAAMVTAECWMHEFHDHDVHRKDPVQLNVVESAQTPPAGVLGNDLVQRLARERLVRLKESRSPSAGAQSSAVSLRWWVAQGPAGLLGVHAELTALEALRRGEHLVSLDPVGDASQWSVSRGDGVDEQQAARALLWAASGWLEPDDLLDLVAVAARRMGWSHLPARDLFAELLLPPTDGDSGP